MARLNHKRCQFNEAFVARFALRQFAALILAIKRLAPDPIAPVPLRDAHTEVGFRRVFLFDRHPTTSAQRCALVVPEKIRELSHAGIFTRQSIELGQILLLEARRRPAHDDHFPGEGRHDRCCNDDGGERCRFHVLNLPSCQSAIRPQGLLQAIFNRSAGYDRSKIFFGPHGFEIFEDIVAQPS